MKRMVIYCFELISTVLCLSLLSGCGSDDAGTNPDNPSVPVLTTATVSAITGTSAQSGGSIISDGGAAVTARGVCWSTNATPTVADGKTTDGSGTGSFTSAITGLAAGTDYYVRAYATNSAGTGYGSVQPFTTLSTGGVGNWGISTYLFSDYNVSLTSDGATMYLGSPLKISHKTGGVWSTPVELPSPLNDPSFMNPTITGDGGRMYFVKNGDQNPYFWYSDKDGDSWTVPEPAPINFGIPALTSSENVDICVSWDGMKLWFSKPVNTNGSDIFYSEFNGTSWSEPVPFSAVNTVEYSEFDMAISGDGSVFYFATSNRPGYSAYSIWASENVGGIWQEPVPLDSNVNISEYEEKYCPAISFDGTEFYFGSYDRDNVLPSGTRVSEREP